MAIFKGQEVYSIDNKGRVNLPAKMRKALSPDAGDAFVVTRGANKCIAMYPMNEWAKYEAQFKNLNPYNEQDSFFLRTVLAWCEEVELDAQQRISLPKRHLELAGIEGKITVVGMIDHIEFWNPETFEAYLNDSEEEYEAVASKVMGR